MPTCSEANIAAKTRIPRPCPSKPAFKPARKVTPPEKNMSPIGKPQHASTFTHNATTTSRKSTGQQTSMIVAEPSVPENDKIQTWRCFECEPSKDLESSLSLLYHKKYQHDKDFTCPVEGCKRKVFKDWKSLLTNHIRLQHQELLRDLHRAPNDYNHQPFYEKLDRVDRKY